MDTFPYILKLANIREKLVNDVSRPDPSWVRITTITMCSKFLTPIDLVKFRENFTKIGSVFIRPKGSLFGGFEWKLRVPTKEFYNQATIGYQDAYTNKSIKIFTNGSIQVAGCADLFDCRRILKQLSFIMKVVLNVDTEIPVDEPSVKMINTNFSLNSSVNLYKIIDKLSNSDSKFFQVTFDPDRYSAVKVKFTSKAGQKQVTASIFRTGKIIVTGAQTLDEIACAYEILNREIDGQMMVSTASEPESFDTIMGGTFTEWVKIINEKKM